MIKKEKAHFYVEKYDRFRQELLLDFVREDEFLYFRNHGDYTPDMHLSDGKYEPTMLLVYGCSPQKTLRRGAILTLDMDCLMEMRNESNNVSENNNLSDDNDKHPATVFLEIFDGARFANLIDDPDRCLISTRIPKEYIVRLDSSRFGSPCTLNNLGENVELHVWNVGQGNTNCISDKVNLTLFDFGASFYYSDSKLSTILNDHMDFMEGHDSVSLIISHWDIDHYNLLCVAQEDFLQSLCRVSYPDKGVGVTMKQVAARIIKNCTWRNAIESPTPKIERKCGIQKIFEGNRYALFAGERSKNKNNSGLLLLVFNDKATALLPADHSNYQIWEQMYPFVCERGNKLHIVVPHHGGDCGKTPIPHEVVPGDAAISVGSNMYGHPRPKTIASYIDAGYSIIRTDRYGRDVFIRL